MLRRYGRDADAACLPPARARRRRFRASHAAVRRYSSQGPAYPRLPEPSWVRAWTGGGRTVHLGNVGEFNAQFEDGAGSGAPGGDHYAWLALFAAPDPELVVLPGAVEPWWVRGLAERPGWGPVQVLSAGADGAGLCASIAADPVLRERIRDCGLRVLPWGRTPDLDRLLAGAAADPAAADARAAAATAVVRRYESKAASHALFRRPAAGFPGVAVPAQQRTASRRRLAGLPAERAAAGATSVVKAEHGVGGSGTWIVSPSRPGPTGSPVRSRRATSRPGTGRPSGEVGQGTYRAAASIGRCPASDSSAGTRVPPVPPDRQPERVAARQGVSNPAARLAVMVEDATAGRGRCRHGRTGSVPA